MSSSHGRTAATGKVESLPFEFGKLADAQTRDDQGSHDRPPTVSPVVSRFAVKLARCVEYGHDLFRLQVRARWFGGVQPPTLTTRRVNRDMAILDREVEDLCQAGNGLIDRRSAKVPSSSFVCP